MRQALKIRDGSISVNFELMLVEVDLAFTSRVADLTDLLSDAVVKNEMSMKLMHGAGNERAVVTLDSRNVIVILVVEVLFLRFEFADTILASEHTLSESTF